MREEKSRFFTKKGAEKFAQNVKANILEDQRSENPKTRIGVGEVNQMVHVEPSKKKFFRRWSVYQYAADKPVARMRSMSKN